MNQLEKSRTQKIVKLHNEIYGHLQMSLEKGIELGGLLTEQKECLKHGEFTPWVKANLPFTDRTAQNYMRLHRERDRLENRNVSDLRTAYKLLREPKATVKLLRQELDAVDEIKDTDEKIQELSRLRDAAEILVRDNAEKVLELEIEIGNLYNEIEAVPENLNTIEKCLHCFACQVNEAKELNQCTWPAAFEVQHREIVKDDYDSENEIDFSGLEKNTLMIWHVYFFDIVSDDCIPTFGAKGTKTYFEIEAEKKVRNYMTTQK